MMLLDVNVLVYAHREDAEGHIQYKTWLEGLVNGHERFGVCDLVLSGFLRVVTHPRVFNPPSALSRALAFTKEIRDAPNCVLIQSGARHWELFTNLCQKAQTKGNLIADAYLAALAIETGCEWITTDRDFSRFQGLKWRHPLT